MIDPPRAAQHSLDGPQLNGALLRGFFVLFLQWVFLILHPGPPPPGDALVSARNVPSFQQGCLGSGPTARDQRAASAPQVDRLCSICRLDAWKRPQAQVYAGDLW